MTNEELQQELTQLKDFVYQLGYKLELKSGIGGDVNGKIRPSNFTTSTLPGSANKGTLTYDTTLNLLKIWNGSSWDAVTPTFEIKTISLDPTSNTGTATITSGSVVYGFYISSVNSGPPSQTSLHVKLSISGTTLTLATISGDPPGNGATVTWTIILRKA